MKKLRIAAYVSLAGGALMLFRVLQAVQAEIDYAGRSDMALTVCLFLVCFAITAGVLWAGINFLRNPVRNNARRVAFVCPVCLYLLLPGLGLGLSLGGSLVIAILIYAFLLRPAIHQAPSNGV